MRAGNFRIEVLTLVAALLCGACTDRAAEAKREAERQAIARGDVEAIALVKAFYTYYVAHTREDRLNEPSNPLSWKDGKYFSGKLKENILYYRSQKSYGLEANVLSDTLKSDKIINRYVDIIDGLSGDNFLGIRSNPSDIGAPYNYTGWDKFKIGRSFYRNGVYYIEILRGDNYKEEPPSPSRAIVVVSVKNEDTGLKINDIFYPDPDNPEGVEKVVDGSLKGEVGLIDEYKAVTAEIKAKYPDIKISVKPVLPWLAIVIE